MQISRPYSVTLRNLKWGGLLLGLTLAIGTRAQTIVYSDFSSTTGLSLNGDAGMETTTDGSVVRLVAAPNTSDAGSFFSTSLVNSSSFSTAFQFRLTSPGGISDGLESGADGFTFALQRNSSTSVGGLGQGIGYSGLANSMAVEFDTYRNSHDPILSNGGSNHVGIDSNGSVSSLVTESIVTRLDNGTLWTAWIDYDGSSLEVRLNNSAVRPSTALLTHTIDIATTIGGSTAYVGFTAGTGGAYANHDILNWVYSDAYQIGGVAAVPEPGTIVLLGLGGLMVLGVRRFRHAR